MKSQLLISTLLALTVGCSQKSATAPDNNEIVAAADTGTQSDLLGNWEQACQAGAFTTAGFAGLNGVGGGGGGVDISRPLGGEQEQGGSQQQEGGEQGEGGQGDGDGDGDGDGQGDGAAGGTIASFQNRLEVENDKMVMVTQGFAAPACSGEMLMEARVDMDYEIANYMAGAPTNVDMTLNSAHAEMKTEAAANAASEANLCGFSNWQANVSRNIAGTDCLQNMPDSSGDEFFQTLSYSNNNFVFAVPSEAQDGETSEDRPTSLGSIPFTREAGSGDGDENGPGDGICDGEGGDSNGDGICDGAVNL